MFYLFFINKKQLIAYLGIILKYLVIGSNIPMHIISVPSQSRFIKGNTMTLTANSDGVIGIPRSV